MFYQENAGLIAQNAKVICRTLRDNLDQAAAFRSWLASQSDADLTGLGFSAQDITWLRSAFEDLHALFLLTYGNPVPASYGITGSYDFSVSVKEITGVT